MKKIIYTLAFYVSIITVLNGQMLLNENFNYGSTTDTLTNPAIGGALWKRHSGSAGPISYLTSSLTYSGYASSGIGGSVQIYNGTTSREDANAIVNTTTSGSVYVSFLLNVSASGGTAGDYFFHLNDSQGTTISSVFRGKLWIKDGSSTGTFVLGLSKGAAVASAVFTSSNYNLNTTHLVVLKYVFNTATTTDDSVYAWIFASGVPTAEPAATLVATDITQTDLPKIRSVCLRQASTGTDTCIVDGIRVSSSWANSPLPVTYTGFSASKSKNTILLTWSTASETNNDHFEIEKSIVNGQWTMVGKVKGNGTSNLENKYQFTDDITSNSKLQTPNVIYFRLKQVDKNGNFTYSKVVTVKNITKLELMSSPNPVNSELNIQMNVMEPVSVSYEIVNIIGKVYHSGEAKLISGNNTIAFDAALLPSGVYFIRTNVNGENNILKIIKQ